MNSKLKDEVIAYGTTFVANGGIGTTGTNGFAGGTAVSGYIEVTEYYQ